jgi:hypothetical protein
MKKTIATLIAGLFATAAFATTPVAPTTPAPAAAPAAEAKVEAKVEAKTDAKVEKKTAHKGTHKKAEKPAETKSEVKASPARGAGAGTGCSSSRRQVIPLPPKGLFDHEEAFRQLPVIFRKYIDVPFNINEASI